MGARKAIMKLLRSGYSGELTAELDLLTSEYPQLGKGEGYYYASGAGSISYDSFSLQVPSGHLFHLKHMVYAFGAAQSGPVAIYDGPGYSAPKFIIWGASISVLYELRDIMGAVFQSIPMFSASATAAYIKIGGIIRERNQGT